MLFGSRGLFCSCVVATRHRSAQICLPVYDDRKFFCLKSFAAFSNDSVIFRQPQRSVRIESAADAIPAYDNLFFYSSVKFNTTLSTCYRQLKRRGEIFYNRDFLWESEIFTTWSGDKKKSSVIFYIDSVFCDSGKIGEKIRCTSIGSRANRRQI